MVRMVLRLGGERQDFGTQEVGIRAIRKGCAVQASSCKDLMAELPSVPRQLVDHVRQGGEGPAVRLLVLMETGNQH